MDQAQISLTLLRLAAEDRVYRTVLNSLEDGIRAAGEHIREAAGSGDGEWASAALDDACDVIENLLGAAYVVCQVQISAVTNRALQVRDCLMNAGRPCKLFGGKADEVRALSSPSPAPAQAVPQVELLWALANYFKHREDWDDPDWTNLTRPASITVDVILQAGLSPASTGNLRCGAEVLGNAGNYDRLEVLADIVDEWARAVLKACQSHLV